MRLTITPPRGRAPRFYHLWLRHITGMVDDGPCHCIRCLIATRDARVTAKNADRTELDLRRELTPPVPGDPAFYLCGVSPAGWASNLHLAFVHGDDTLTMTGWDGTRVEVVGASRIDIPVVPDGFEERAQSQTRCRNWRFARGWFKPEPGLMARVVHGNTAHEVPPCDTQPPLFSL